MSLSWLWVQCPHFLPLSSSHKVPNAQTRGPLLELLLCVKGRDQAFIRGELVSIQSRRNDVHHHLGAQQCLRLAARRPDGQPNPPGSGPLHRRRLPRPGAQLAAGTKKRNPVSRGGDDNFVLVRLVDPAVLRHRSRWVHVAKKMENVHLCVINSSREAARPRLSASLLLSWGQRNA